jgi:hypothetical protein
MSSYGSINEKESVLSPKNKIKYGLKYMKRNEINKMNP